MVTLQVKLQVVAWIGGSRVRIPERTFRFSRLQSRDNGCTIPILEPVEPTNDVIVAIGVYQLVNHCNMCEIFHDCLTIVLYPSENIIRRRVIFKKKRL